MKKALLCIVGFVAITIVLTWFWGEWGRLGYGRFLRVVAPPIYDLIGFEDARVGAFRQRYINFIPFVGLMLVTPGLSIRRRLGGLFGGLFLLFLGHLALNLTERMSPGAHLPFVPSLLSDALPFVIWVILAFPALVGFLPDSPPNATSSVEPDAQDAVSPAPPATSVEQNVPDDDRA